jgi:hypothetical protein
VSADEAKNCVILRCIKLTGQLTNNSCCATFNSINLHRLWSGYKLSVIKIIECGSACTQRSQVPVPPARHPLPLRFFHTRRCFNEWHIRRIAGDVLPRYLEMKSTGFKPTHQRDLNRRARERVEPAAPGSMPSSCSSPGLGYRRPEYKIHT